MIMIDEFNYNEWPDINLSGEVLTEGCKKEACCKNKKPLAECDAPLMEGKIVKTYIHYNKNGQVDAWGDTIQELADKLGMSYDVVNSMLAKSGKPEYDRYHRVEYDVDDDFSDDTGYRLDEPENAAERDEINRILADRAERQK